MFDPQASLAIFAEVSVSLAGFSGIVITFGNRSLGSLTRLEVRRLTNLFVLSGMVLLFALVSISVLHIEALDLTVFWRLSSAVLFLSVTPWLVLDIARLQRLEREEQAQIHLGILYSFNAMAVGVLILQLLNAVSLGESWPVFLALSAAVGGAFQQFILLVRMGYRGGGR